MIITIRRSTDFRWINLNARWTSWSIIEMITSMKKLGIEIKIFKLYFNVYCIKKDSLPPPDKTVSI